MRALWLALALIAAGCSGGGGVSETGNPQRTYLTSSGDGFGRWRIEDASFDSEWSVTSSAGSVQYVYSLAGSCGGPTTFGFKSCTISTSSCVAGAAACPTPPAPGETVNILELPGVSALIYTPTQNLLHSGSVLGSCDAEIAGDYLSASTGLGSIKLFGLYRSDSTFTNFIDSSFGLYDPASPKLFYATTTASGTGATTLGPVTCQNGIRTFELGGIPVRATMTAGGLWGFSLPPGYGGAISFRTDLAASLGDLANKRFYGFSAYDVGLLTMVEVTTGPIGGNSVPLTSAIHSTGPQPNITGVSFMSAKSAGSTYGLNGNPPGFLGYTYATNLLSSTYPTPGDAPGLFISTGGSGTPDQGTIVSAMKSRGKVVIQSTLFGNRGGAIKVIGSSIFFEQ
ncbi:MAG TPA: hypothetical protein VM598_11625 [Bdellovibrionota bacterium]|nr:hypothetical protein [Bdellovibrionota bacterium]